MSSSDEFASADEDVSPVNQSRKKKDARRLSSEVKEVISISDVGNPEFLC